MSVLLDNDEDLWPVIDPVDPDEADSRCDLCGKFEQDLPSCEVCGMMYCSDCEGDENTCLECA